jgi:adenylate cyclase
MAGETAHERATKLWVSYLTGDTAGLEPHVRMLRGVFGHLPSDPRCKVCHAPFRGIGGIGARLLGFGAGKSRFNPMLCDRCEKIVTKQQVGAEVPLTLLFADIRDSTALAEKIGATGFHQLINRFYKASTDVLVDTGALIDKLVGDEVVALYAPGIAGANSAAKAIEAGRRMMRATASAEGDASRVAIGVGIHSGPVYVGAVGSRDGQSDITVLGDAANTAARLASQAGPGEILASEDACRAAGIGMNGEVRTLHLKGRTQPVTVRVLRAE